MLGNWIGSMVPILVLGAALGFWAFSIADFARSDAPGIRTLPREVWAVILVLGSVVGAAAWWRFGRPRE